MVRKIERVWRSKPTIEGADVHLKRAFGYYQVPIIDCHCGLMQNLMGGG